MICTCETVNMGLQLVVGDGEEANNRGIPGSSLIVFKANNCPDAFS